MTKSNNFDPKYGSKGIENGIFCVKMRPQGRACCKFTLVFIALWLVGYFGLAYVSVYKSQLLDEFKKEDLNIKNLQEKISQLVAKGLVKNGNDKLDAPVDEREINTEKTEVTVEKELPEKYKLDDGITEEALKYIKEFNLKDPGENGHEVVLPANLSEDVRKKIKLGFDTYGYNGINLNLFQRNFFF